MTDAERSPGLARSNFTILIDHPGTRMLDYAQTKLRLCGRANDRSCLRDQNINSL
jgi:hypothetical protein